MDERSGRGRWVNGVGGAVTRNSAFNTMGPEISTGCETKLTATRSLELQIIYLHKIVGNWRAMNCIRCGRKLLVVHCQILSDVEREPRN